MPNRLSHSQINRWTHCPQSWHYHYVERYRPIAIASPLVFGSAIGKTFEHILQAHTNNAVDLNIAKDFFDKAWTWQEINGVPTNLKESKDIVYLKSDLDTDLAKTPWESLQVKAHLMIEAFIRDLLPKIIKVYSTEEEVLLTSGEDSSIGFADAVVDMEGYNTPIVIDFKTAGRPYTSNSVQESTQLAQYLYTLGDKYKTNLAGYAVFLKNINKNRKKICKSCSFDGSDTRHKLCNNQVDGKRCNGEYTETTNPSCDIQIIVDTIGPEFQNKVIDNIGEVNDNINAGNITMNVNNCLNNGFHQRCEFYDLCHNESTKGFIKLEKRETACS
jgi:hypothetical protein